LKPRIREDKDEIARCPFCAAALGAPEPIKSGTGECTGGRCGCGAVYCLDATGHNVGEAYLDALTLAFGEGADLLSVAYDEVVLEYQPGRNTLAPVKDERRMSGAARMIFIKVRNPIDK
jgi:hypothetical protein